MSKILITGGNGFIGSHLVKSLVKKTNQVALTVRTTSDLTRIKDLISQIKLINDDEKSLSDYFCQNQVDVVIHLATYYVKQETTSDVAKMVEANINFPAKLLALTNKYGVRNWINAGTCFEYELTNHPIDELQSIKPYNLYAVTKVAFEQLLKYYTSNGLKAVTLKFFYPYGENDNQKIINLMIRSILDNRQMSITKGEQQLDFIHVSDIVHAIEKALNYLHSNKYSNYQVFNVGTGVGTKLIEVVDILNQISNKNLIICNNEYNKNEIMYMVADIAKAKKQLGYKPEMDIKTGLKQVYEYYLKQERLK